MTVAALMPSAEYLEDGVTTAWAAPFRFLESAHLVVQRIDLVGAVTELVRGSQWSATGGTTDSGGTVTTTAPGAVGERLRIFRRTPRSQIADYATNDTFPAETHEAALDRSMLLHQEQDVARLALEARAIRVPDGETAQVVPPREERFGQIAYWDGAGQLSAVPAENFFSNAAADSDFDGGLHGIAGSGDVYEGGYHGIA